MIKDRLPVILLEDFRFNDAIQVLEPVISKNNQQRFTYVLEKQRAYLIQSSIKRVIRKCCFLFGTSLDEALRFSRTITKATNKLPIVLGTTEQPYILIPTLSPDRPYTMWLAHHAILNCDVNSKVDCVVHLDNQIRPFFKTNVSTATLQTQLTRAMFLKRNYRLLKDLMPEPISENHVVFIDSNNLKRLD